MGLLDYLFGGPQQTSTTSTPVTDAGSTLPPVVDTVSGIPITPGDTLSELGRDHGFDWANSKIARNGEIVTLSPSQIQVGDFIIPQTHAVQPGDTLSEIARDNNFDYNDAQIIRDGRVYEIGEDGIPANQIQPGDQIVPSSESASTTESAEVAADEQGSDSNPEQTTQECSGWIAVRSHYFDFNLVAVGGRVTISKLENGQATQVLQEEVNYTEIAENGLFVSRRPMVRPALVDGALEGGPAVPATTISQAQEATVAAKNGNPLVLFGGEDGLEPGQYRVTFRPNVRHGKLRIDPNPITQGTNAGRYKILSIDGTEPTEWTNNNTTDQYLQVPSTTAVNEEWSQDVVVMCRSRNQPSIVEFQWTDFATWDGASNKRLRSLHPEARHVFFVFVNKIEENFSRSFRAAQGHRTFAEQNTLYAQGRTAPGNIVTNARGGRSNHNYGTAIDIFEIVGRAVDWNADYGDAAEVGDALDLEWGGRWTTIVDRPHFQLDIGLNTRQLLELYNNGKTFTYDGDTYVRF